MGRSLRILPMLVLTCTGHLLGAQAVKVGEAIATRAKEKGVTSVVFDRGGYTYAAQVRSLAEAARAGGLTF